MNPPYSNVTVNPARIAMRMIGVIAAENRIASRLALR